MRHLGLAQQHTNPDIQRQAQEQCRQLHHHAEIDADAVVVALADELRTGGKTHKAVQRDGQHRLAPGAAFLKVFGWANQLVESGQRQQQEACDPELVQIEMIDLNPVGHGANFFATVQPGRHE